MMTRPQYKNTPDLLAMRRAKGLTQAAFWGKIGVTQSAGSRYETGRPMARTVALLFDLIYMRSIDIAKVKGEDMMILAHLRAHYPDLHARLLREVNATANKRTRTGSRRAGA